MPSIPRKREYLLAGATLALALWAGGWLGSHDVSDLVVTERKQQLAALKVCEAAQAERTEALTVLLNRKPVQIGDAYLSCRVQVIEPYSKYVSNYWRSPL